MNRLLEAWEQLLREATDADYDEMQDAMFKVALILERHNYPKKMSDELYQEHLTRDLLRVVLDDKRQKDAIDFMVAMVKARKDDADTFLYALSKTKPVLLATPLLKLINEQGHKWSIDAAYEAVTGLDNCLKAGGEVIEQAFKSHDPSKQLDEWADSDNDDLADKADRVLEKVEALLGTAP